MYYHNNLVVGYYWPPPCSSTQSVQRKSVKHDKQLTNVTWRASIIRGYNDIRVLSQLYELQKTMTLERTGH